MQKSTMLKKEAAASSRQWFVIDATDMILGRLSVKAADILRGKNKPNFTPNVDGGDYVVIINANKIKLSGNKAQNEKWYNHSHYMGGLRERTGAEMIAKYPVELVERSVKGMLPKNKLARRIITKMFVYAGSEHPHTAQNPQPLNIPTLRKVAK